MASVLREKKSELASGESLKGQLAQARSQLVDFDAAVVAGGTCAGYAHFCTTEPLVAWMCPETCGPYPGDCVFLSRYGNGAARYAADCASSWSLWYASYQACMADSPNWVAGSDPSNPTACPMDPTGISCYQTDESLGSSASC